MNQAADTTTTQASARKEAPGVLKRSSRYSIDPLTIAVDPEWNNRIDMGDIEGLASSIQTQLQNDPDSGGLLEELGVQRIPTDHPLAEGGKKLFVLRWGHRRHAAILKLIKKGTSFPVGVPAKIVDKAQDLQLSKIQMIAENTGQKPLLPLEEAAGYKSLRDGWPELGIKGMTIAEICKAVGRAVPHVTEMLALLEADDSVKEAVQKGEIGKQMGKVIASRAKGDKEAQKALVAAAKSAKNKKGGKAEVIRQAENVKRAKNGKKPVLRALSDKELVKLGVAQAERVKAALTDANKPADFDIRSWVKGDDKLALAAAWGALEALKAAAGQNVDLAI